MFQRQLKMALKIGNVFINEDDLIPVIVKANTKIDTYVKGYHVYKSQLWMRNWKLIWSLIMWWINMLFCVKKNTSIIGHLPFGKKGKFAKMIDILLPQSRPRCRIQNCHKWQRNQSWRRKEVVQKRANSCCYIYTFSSTYWAHNLIL